MIRRLEPQDIAQILQLEDDNLEKILPCEKGEWVQWLMSNAKNERLLIVGRLNEDQLLSYCVVVNNVFPPISDSVCILYMPEKVIGDKEIKEKIMEWAMESKAKTVIFQCNNSAALSQMDGKEIAIMGKWEI